MDFRTIQLTQGFEAIYEQEEINDFVKSIESIKIQSSRLIGVCYKKQTGRWGSSIVKNRKYIHVGYFNTKEEAFLAIQEKIKELELS